MTHSEVRVIPASYGLYPYEHELLKREVRSLCGGELSATGTVTTDRPSALLQLAFAERVEVSGATHRTVQSRRETPSAGARPKNSTYGPHGIHRYKGKFYPQLAKSLINASSMNAGVVFDPFGGSGTVATEAILDGRAAVSVDCNPVAVACARAKVTLASADRGDLSPFLDRMLTYARKADSNSAANLDQFPVHLLDELTSWFPTRVLGRINAVLEAVRSEADEDLVNVGHVLVSDLIREVSQQEPKDLRIRRRREPISDAPVSDLLAARVTRLHGRMQALWQSGSVASPPGTATVALGDSSDAATISGLVDREGIGTIVSSPPYGTALPYIDTDRLSLAALFSYDPSGRRQLESRMIGSRDIRTREMRDLEHTLQANADELRLPDSTVTFLQSYLDAVQCDDAAGFRKQQAPSVLTRYFVAMRDVFDSFVPHLNEGADVWMVLGDSRSSVGGHTWIIPTVESIALIGKEAGLSLEDTIPITVTREDVLHSRHSITTNQILHFKY